MSDLALISAGETPMEVDRVSCFVSAVMGFSPLIFELDETAGWNEFYKACEQVWNNVHRDAKLPDKWVRCTTYNKEAYYAVYNHTALTDFLVLFFLSL